MIIVRYADDFIVGFQHREDAERFLQELRERFAKFSLELHPGQDPPDRVRSLCRPSRQRAWTGKPETFDFLGFTHICGKTRKGRFSLMRRTIAQADAGEAAGGQRRAPAAPAPARPGAGPVARQRGAGHLCLLRRARQRRGTASVPHPGERYWLRALRRRSQRGPHQLGANASDCTTAGSRRRVSSIPGPTSASTSQPEAGAQCVSTARWDLCGGRPEPLRVKGRPYRDR